MGTGLFGHHLTRRSYTEEKREQSRQVLVPGLKSTMRWRSLAETQVAVLATPCVATLLLESYQTVSTRHTTDFPRAQGNSVTYLRVDPVLRLILHSHDLPLSHTRTALRRQTTHSIQAVNLLNRARRPSRLCLQPQPLDIRSRVRRVTLLRLQEVSVCLACISYRYHLPS
jgi:hypothetical protein